MSQFDFGVIDPLTKDGTQLADDMNNWRDAVHSSHLGPTRPSYVRPGMLWVDSSVTPNVLKLWDGTADRTIATLSGAAFTGDVSVAGNITAVGASRRITGDMDNAIIDNRLSFQTSNANSATAPFFIPSGTSRIAGIGISNKSTFANSSWATIAMDTNAMTFNCTRDGSGPYLPIVFNTSATERLRIAANGDIEIPGVARRIKGTFDGLPGSNRTLFQTSTTNGSTLVGAIPNGAAQTGGFAGYNSSNPDNASTVAVYVNGTAIVDIEAGKVGTGTYLPIRLSAGGGEQMRIRADGGVVIGNGGGFVGGAIGRLQVASLADMPIYVRNDNTGGYWTIGPNSTNDFVIANSAFQGVYISNGANVWSSISDERLKTDLVPIEDACNFLSTVRTVVGRFKTDDADKRRQFLIAQDWESCDGVCNVNKDGFLGMGYTDTIPTLIAAIKELTARVKMLEAWQAKHGE